MQLGPRQQRRELGSSAQIVSYARESSFYCRLNCAREKCGGVAPGWEMDCGSTRGPKTENEVTQKMIGDFIESHPKEMPQFALLLGDIVYNFGETEYYYDQFYEPYRNYPAPVLAAANPPQLPLPAESGFKWYWQQIGASDQGPLKPDQSSSNAVFPSTPQQLIDGWLKLKK